AHSVADRRHDDRNRFGGIAGGFNGIRRVCNDHIDFGMNKFGGKRRQTVKPAVRIANFESDVAFVQPTELLKALFERCKANLPLWVPGCEYLEHAEAAHPLGLLGAGHERPSRRNRAANDFDKLAPSHSITSSAAFSRPYGTVRPNVLAALR